MFYTARLKLTAWYLVIIMAVSLSFSAVIYRALTIEVERFGRIQRSRIENQIKNGVIIQFNDRPPYPMALPVEDAEVVNFIKRRILMTLAVVNSTIFVLAGALGYLLAGRTLRPIADMVEEQNRFISDASHELRTPLTALKSTLEVHLRDKNLNLTSAKKVIRDSIEEVNTLQSLSDSLLTLAQYQKPGNDANREKLPLSEIILEAIRQVTPLAKEKNITIKHTITNTNITGSRYHFIDLFVILLDNAIKYSHASGTVTISTLKADNSITITIRDEGIGIAKKDLPHIFDRFYRTDSARTKNAHNGYGLGLAIAKKITDRYHGHIKVESKIGKGSTFTLTFSA